MSTFTLTHPATKPHAPAHKVRLSTAGRALAVVAAILVAAAFCFPLWSMALASPQYPDGLHLHVYATHFAGAGNPDIDDLAEINTLNHYIGMAELHAENFPELKAITGAFGVAILLAVVAAALASPAAAWGALAVLGVAGAGGMGTAFQRLYEYGHHLDPLAPVKVPPFTPAMLGDNQLANFTTHGALGVGALTLAGAAIALGVAVWRCREAAQ